MIQYFSDLAGRHQNRLVGRYRNAIYLSWMRLPVFPAWTSPWWQSHFCWSVGLIISVQPDFRWIPCLWTNRPLSWVLRLSLKKRFPGRKVSAGWMQAAENRLFITLWNNGGQYGKLHGLRKNRLDQRRKKPVFCQRIKYRICGDWRSPAYKRIHTFPQSLISWKLNWMQNWINYWGEKAFSSKNNRWRQSAGTDNA